MPAGGLVCSAKTLIKPSYEMPSVGRCIDGLSRKNSHSAPYNGLSAKLCTEQRLATRPVVWDMSLLPIAKPLVRNLARKNLLFGE